MKKKEIIKYAYNNSPFYKKRYVKLAEDILVGNINIEDIPIVRKEDIIECELNMLSEEFYEDYIQHKYTKFYTSGSTGTCLQIYWGDKEYNSSLLGLWYLRKKYYGIEPDDRCCTFFLNGRQGNKEYKQIRSGNMLSFSKSNLDEKRIRDIYHEMEKFQPRYLIIEPSIAVLFSRCKKKYHFKDIESICYVELTGEYLYNEVRKEIEDCFKCNIANQYGAYEVNSIAYECPYGNMHCMSKNVYVEILNKKREKVSDGVEGEICVTSLTNRTMPFIRYMIGDRGKICKNITCKCGNLSPILHLVSARSNDYIRCKDGSDMHYSVFVKAVENTNKVLNNPIIQFQIRQVDYKYFVVKLVLSSLDIDKDKLIWTFCQLIEEERLVNSKLEFCFLDELFPDSKTGKLKCFVGMD